MTEDAFKVTYKKALAHATEAWRAANRAQEILSAAEKRLLELMAPFHFATIEHIDANIKEVEAIYLFALRLQTRHEETNAHAPYGQKVAQLFQLAAGRGHSESMSEYGYLLLIGLYVEPNQREGLRLINAAAERGVSRAYYYLAQFAARELDYPKVMSLSLKALDPRLYADETVVENVAFLFTGAATSILGDTADLSLITESAISGRWSRDDYARVQRVYNKARAVNPDFFTNLAL